MNKYLLLLLLFSIGYSQASGLTLFGIGEDIRDTDPASLAMGNSKFFSGNSKNISTGSSSSLWRSALTRFTIQSGMNYLTVSSFPKQFQHNLTHFSLIFPVGDKKVIGLGIQPAFRTNRLEIKEYIKFLRADESVTGAPIAYKSQYILDGGISELFLQYSQKLTSLFSIGIEYSFLFGNQYLNDKMWTYDLKFSEDENIEEVFIQQNDNIYIYGINSDSTTIDRLHKFSGTVFTFESRYTRPHQELVCRTSVNGITKIITEIIQSINNESFTNNFDYTESMFISDIELGYHYQYIGNAGLIIEVHKKNKLNIPEAVALFNIMPPKEHSIHLGTYYQVANPKIGFWNNLNIRGGAYLKELDFTGGKLLDYGGTLGLGIEYLGNTQSIDLALRAGKKESRILDGKYEKYISFHIGITAGEKWFMKRRRK